MPQDNNTNPNLNDFAISSEMFSWIKDNIPFGSTILEFGSGSGTIELCKHYKVFSIEHDKNWIGHCKESNYIHAPIKDYESFQWYDKDIVKQHLPSDYDLIIVDGPPNNPETQVIGRHGFIENLDMFDVSVPIIFDDVNREDEYKNMIDAVNTLGKEHELIKGWQKSFAIVK